MYASFPGAAREKSMSELHGRVLFVPVSGPRGMGEYARSLALATAAAQRWPDLQIHFALSRGAPYAAETPFPATLLPSSPTFHSTEVIELIRSFRPTLVIFDNAGRTAQLRAASNSGARVVFVSSRRRQRRKAFRLSAMRMLDEHWIAYPSFIAGAPGPVERMKLRLLGRPRVQFLDTVLPPPDSSLSAAVMAQFCVHPGAYVLTVPGGGTDHPGAEHAPQKVAEAARRLAVRGFQTVLVGVAAPASADLLRIAPRMPMAMLAELIRGARLVISNGGDTLLQAIACGRPCIGVPIAGDQAHRINRCVQAGLALRAHLDADDLEQTAVALLQDESMRDALVARLVDAHFGNGMDLALSAIERLAIPRDGPSAATR